MGYTGKEKDMTAYKAQQLNNVLIELGRVGVLGRGDVARLLNLKPSPYIKTGILDRLENDGYIHSHLNTDNPGRPVWQYWLSEKGQQSVKQMQ